MLTLWFLLNVKEYLMQGNKILQADSNIAHRREKLFEKQTLMPEQSKMVDNYKTDVGIILDI